MSRARIPVGFVAGLAAFGALACQPVTSVPATLARGVYCLAADVNADGRTPFTLEGDATLDCQGHAIRDAQLSTWVAVTGSGDNLEIRNCRFDGFHMSVWFDGVSHFRIVDNTFRAPMNIGIYADGDDGLVSGNTFIYADSPTAGYPEYWYGQSISIEVLGSADIVHNTITSAIYKDGSGWTDRVGIISVGGVVAFNVVRGLVPGQGYWRGGIDAHGAGVVYRNTVSAAAISATPNSDIGIDCNGSGVASVQNVAVGYVTPYLHCTDSAQTGLMPRVR